MYLLHKYYLNPVLQQVINESNVFLSMDFI